MADLYIGLMSGTSADGIDLALVDFTQSDSPQLINSHYQPYTAELVEQITSLYLPGDNEIDRAHALDKQLAHCFASAIEALLTKQGLTASEIIAIGNHGQTVRHRPRAADRDHQSAFTLQIGCNQTLACLTGIPVIGQFRIKDMALGGQGAPLVPAFHQHIMPASDKDNVVLNIGGIANISFLPTNRKQTLGFDTGPGNCLLDEWFAKHNNAPFDKDGAWAASGKQLPGLLAKLLNEPYFSADAPKSTGREIFNIHWLEQFIDNSSYRAQDIQATLVSLTAETIAKAIQALSEQANVWLCGGGRHNLSLVNAIKQQLPHSKVDNIDTLGFDGDALEAVAFAWLAYAYKNNLPSNMPAVTGASKSTTLGVLFNP